ncbi:MAG: hypothetical protein WCH34_08005 [Bacteroidota bacterium]
MKKLKFPYDYLLVIFLWLIAYIFIRNIQWAWIIDLFNLSNFAEETTHQYFKLICEITASVFAILIAVITFGFGLLGNNSRRRKRFDFLKQWRVLSAISIPVVMILFSLHSAFSLHNLKQTNDLTTAYFLGIMFVVFVLLLFPFTVFLIKKTDTVDKIIKLINEFTGEKDFNSAITDELINYIQEFDRDAYNNHLLSQLNKRCLSIIGDASDRRQANIIFQSLIKVWTAGNVDAARVNEEQYYVSVWLSVKDIYFNAAKNKAYLLHYQELESFTRAQIGYLMSISSIGGLTSAAENLSEIFLYQIQFNCPPQETISDFYLAYEGKDAPKSDHISNMQWDHIFLIFMALNQLQSCAIELNSKHLYQTVISKLNSILSEFSYKNELNLGEYQERFIVSYIFSFQTDSAELALQKGMFKNANEAFLFNYNKISDYVREQKPFSDYILKVVEEYYLFCQKNNYLDSMSIKNLGSFGRLITTNYITNEIAQSALFTVVEFLGKLKVEIQKQEGYLENEHYLEIKKGLESLKTQLENVHDNPNALKTISRIDEILTP